MSLKNALISITGLVLAIILLQFILEPSEEQRILSLLDKTLELTAFSEPEPKLMQAAKAKQISELFTENTTFDFSNADYPMIEFNSRQELKGKILQGRAVLGALELALTNPVVTIDRQTATVELQGSALGKFLNREEQFFDMHLIKVMLSKVDNQWLINGAVHLENLRN